MLAIKGGKVYTITKGVIDGGTVLVDGGKIVKVGKRIKVPDDAEVIDVSGKVVMPGPRGSLPHRDLGGEDRLGGERWERGHGPGDASHEGPGRDQGQRR